MANDLTANPIKVDTAGATALTSKTFTVYKIRWVGATTAGHTAVIHNEASQVIFAAEATGANYTESESFDPAQIVAGLIVPTLGSGALYIYCNRNPVT